MKVSPISNNSYGLNAYKNNTQNAKPAFKGIQREAVEHYITSNEFYENPEKNKAWLLQTAKKHRKEQRFVVCWHYLGFYTVNRMVNWRRDPFVTHHESFDTKEIKMYSDAGDELLMNALPDRFDRFDDACAACEKIERNTMNATKGEFDEIYNYCF